MTIWSVIFIDTWKRKQSALQFEWDTIDFDNSDENVRPKFEQEIKARKVNKITGEVEPFISLTSRILSYLLSSSVVFLSVCCVLIFIVAIIVYQNCIKLALNYSLFSNILGSVTGACINLIIIVILGKFYEWIAVKLTDYEHHKVSLLSFLEILL